MKLKMIWSAKIAFSQCAARSVNAMYYLLFNLRRKRKRMKKVIWVMLITLGLAGFLFGTASAGGENEYPNGIEGIKAGSVPPAGILLQNV
jgi:hypothetical protein